VDRRANATIARALRSSLVDIQARTLIPFGGCIYGLAPATRQAPATPEYQALRAFDIVNLESNAAPETMASEQVSVTFKMVDGALRDAPSARELGRGEPDLLCRLRRHGTRIHARKFLSA